MRLPARRGDEPRAAAAADAATKGRNESSAHSRGIPAAVTDSIGFRQVSRRSAGADDVGAALAAGALALAGALPLACAGLLVVRRLAGGLPGGGRPVGILAVALTGVGFVVAADLIARAAAGWSGERAPGVAWQPLAARIALCCAMVAMAPPWPWRGTAWPAVATAAAAMTAALVRVPRRRTVARTMAEPEARHRAVPAPRVVCAVCGGPTAAPAEASAGALSQRLTRFHRADTMTDRIEGTVVVVVPPGERSAPTHVAFCPPFSVSPLITIAAVEAATEAEADAVETLPWGTRIECRLEDAADDPVEVVVSFTADGPLPSSGRSATVPVTPDH